MTAPTNVTQARDRLATARQRLKDLRAEASTAIREVATHKDHDLTAEGLEKRRVELRSQARAKFEPRIDQLQAQIRSDAETAEQWLERSRPQLGDDAGQLIRAQIKWDQVRTQLDAGATLRQVIASADADTLLAIREWAPSHLSSEARKVHPKGLAAGEFEAPEKLVGDTLAAVDGRLAEVAGGDFSQAMKIAKSAREEAAYSAPLLQHANAELAGSPTDPVRAAIDAHYGAQFATAEAGAGDGEQAESL